MHPTVKRPPVSRMCNDCQFSHRALPCHPFPQHLLFASTSSDSARTPATCHVGRCMWQSMLDVFLEEGEGGVEVFFFFRRGAERDATEVHRNPFEPQAETSANFCIGMHFVFFWVARRKNLEPAALRAQPKTQTLGSSTSTGKPLPQHGLGMSNCTQKSSRHHGKMSTRRAETHQLELFVCSFSFVFRGLSTKVVETSRACISAGWVWGRLRKALVRGGGPTRRFQGRVHCFFSPPKLRCANSRGLVRPRCVMDHLCVPRGQQLSADFEGEEAFGRGRGSDNTPAKVRLKP